MPKDKKTVYDHGFAVNENEVQDRALPEQSEVDLCKQWLAKFAKKGRVEKRSCVHSYHLKHIIEEHTGEYVSNGACIKAAVELDFDYWQGVEKINANFYMELQLPEDYWQRIPPSRFSKWLFEQENSFIRDSRFDPHFPRQSTRFIDFWRYLNGERGVLLEELCAAWERFTGRMAPRPDLIDAEVVYERECDFISYGDKYPAAESGYTYLYALVEVGKAFDAVSVRYVGQTESPSRRLIEHILRPGSIERVKWIGGLLSRGEWPQMVIFKTVPKSEADIYEKAAIYAFSEWETLWDDAINGFPPLDEALLNRRL